MRAGLKVCAGIAWAVLALGCRGGVDVCEREWPLSLGVSVTPAQLDLAPGERARVSARLFVDPCSGVRTGFQWNASDTTVARVEADTDTSAWVVGRGAGTAMVIATLAATRR